MLAVRIRYSIYTTGIQYILYCMTGEQKMQYVLNKRTQGILIRGQNQNGRKNIVGTVRYGIFFFNPSEIKYGKCNDGMVQ